MGKKLTHITDCSAYPGRYVPMPEIEELLNDKKRCMTQPAINMDEFDSLFRIEVSLPGIHKEDIMILVDDHTLTIKVIHKEHGGAPGRPRIHEFDVNYFERQIELPEKCDAEFISAEYRDGILNLLIPKVTEHSGYQPGEIVVY